MRIRGIGILGALACTVALGAPGVAGAGTYTVHGCKLADGTPTGIDGWVEAENAAWAYATNGCPSGALTARLQRDADHDPGASAHWTFTAPAGTEIVALAGERRKSAGPRIDGIPTALVRTNLGDVDQCQQAFSPACIDDTAREIRLVFAGARYIQLVAACVGTGRCPPTSGEKALMEWRRIAIDLQDDAAPSGTPTGGSLLDDAVESGLGSVMVDAEDTGGGVHRAVLRVSGATRVDQELGDGRCRKPFRHQVPCPLGTATRLDLDTASVGDGDHEVAVDLVDAGGNVATVAGPFTRTFDNRPPVIQGAPSVEGSAVVGEPLICVEPAISAQRPTLAYRWYRAAADGSDETLAASAGGRTYTPTSADVGRALRCEVVATDRGGAASAISARRSGPFAGGHTVQASGVARAAAGGTAAADGLAVEAWFEGARRPAALATYAFSVGVEGRVRDRAGRGIGGVPVQIATQGAPALGDRVLATTSSRPDGGFRLRFLARLPSTSLVVTAHRAGDSALADLSLRVQAGIALSVPSRVRARGVIRFRGRLLGGPFPARGKLIELRARGRGSKRWIPFRTIRADRRGAFRANYRLRRGFRNVTYEFQALARQEAGYPYAAGTSRVRAVRVG